MALSLRLSSTALQQVAHGTLSLCTHSTVGKLDWTTILIIDTLHACMHAKSLQLSPTL